MPSYTCVTSNRGRTHASQHHEDNAERALKKHIAEFPFFEGINPIGEELYWLQSIALGKQSLTLVPVRKSYNVWKWTEGEDYNPPYSTYIIKTDNAL